MIYGASYEASTRTCETCGHYTNVHMRCDSCEAHICEDCVYLAAGKRYCGLNCHQEDCEHAEVAYDVIDDVDRDAGYAARLETWTCKACGLRLDSEGMPVRRAAGSQGRLPFDKSESA